MIANQTPGKPPIRFLSVCSGIEAASQALIPLGGFECGAVSEIDPFPCHVLAQRYGATRPRFMPDPDEPWIKPKEAKHRAAAIKAVSTLPLEGDIPNLGDMSRFMEWPDAEFDALFGGTPCQSFSIAGLREGLADARGNLMLTFGAIAARYRPRWLLWENVPGVLSSDDGRDFAQLLGLLTGRQVPVPADGWGNSGIIPGIADAYGIAWRVLDAQHVRTRRFRRAVPQRRRRVFVVGYLGDWRRAAAVLFDRESLRRDPPPRREAGQGATHAVAPSLVGSGRGVERAGETRGQDPVIAVEVVAMSSGQANAEIATDGTGTTLTCLHEAPIIAGPNLVDTIAAPTLRAEGFDATDDGTGKGTPIIPVRAIAFDSKGTEVQTETGGASPTLRAMAHADSKKNGGGQIAVAIQERAVSENPNAGPDGAGVNADGAAYTLEARTQVQAVAHALTAGMAKSASRVPSEQGALVPEARTQVQAVAFAQNTRDEVRLIGGDGCIAGALAAEPGAKQQAYVAFDMRGREGGAQLEGPHDTANIRAADGGSSRSYVAEPWAVRRLTPVECERLMGNDDDFTNIAWRGKPFAPDGNRYKACGNSWALNAVEWIGERMVEVDGWTDEIPA